MKILVADDESHIVNVIATKLRGAGFEVETASDGDEALSKALDLQPDLLITDYNMPGRNGVDVCRAWHEQQPERCRAILLTAKEGQLPLEELRPFGILTILGKPFSPRNLLAVVQEHLPT